MYAESHLVSNKDFKSELNNEVLKVFMQTSRRRTRGPHTVAEHALGKCKFSKFSLFSYVQGAQPQRVTAKSEE